MKNSDILLRAKSDRFEPACKDCWLSSKCFYSVMDKYDWSELKSAIRKIDPIHKRKLIYSEKDNFSAIYIVRSGSIKLFSMAPNGDENISGFCVAGDIFGIDGLSTNRYSNSAVAMETTSVCRIDFGEMSNLSRRNINLQRYFFKVLSLKIIGQQEHMMWMAKCSSEQKVASFLLSISSKQASLRMSTSVFNLAISRSDMANYLGLTVETASRVFAKFKKDGLISLSGKEISLLSLDGLKAISSEDEKTEAGE